jgi:hypothetical protein
VVAHVLRNAKGGVICSAQILDAQNLGGISVPRRVVLAYPDPSASIEMRMTLWDDQRYVALNRQLGAEDMQRLFTRPTLAGVQTFDLARGADAATANGVRAAGGFTR